jgi:hypothetical protein
VHGLRLWSELCGRRYRHLPGEEIADGWSCDVGPPESLQVTEVR